MSKYDGIDFTPPEGVRAEARRGLEWRREHGRGGTEVGVARARDLSNGKRISPETARRMVAFFERHESSSKRGQGFSPGEPGFPSAGRIAWALWGGDAGFAWARKLVRQMDKADDKSQRRNRLPPLVFGERGRRACRALFPLVSSDSATTWIHVAMEGRWDGHPSGPFELTRRTFDQIVSNFERNPNPIPLDYEHSTEFAIPAPAAGWVQGIEVRDGEDGAELWAHVELTRAAADRIRAGEYRFSSGVFVFGAIDPVSGEKVGVEMTSLALTNVPFIRGATPIALSLRATERVRGSRMSMVDKAALMAELRKLDGDTLSAEQIAKLAAAMAAMDEARTGQGGESEPDSEPESVEMEMEPEEEPVAAADKGEDKEGEKKPMSAGYMAGDEDQRVPAMDCGHEALAAMAEQYGMSVEEFLAALPGMLEGGAEARMAPLKRQVEEATLALSARDHTIAALSKRAETAEGELARFQAKEARDAVETLVCTGRLLDTARSDFERLYLNDRAAFDRIASALPEVVPLGGHAAQLEPATEGGSIDEADPEVKRLREFNRSLPRAAQDAVIRKALSARHGSRV